MLKYYLALALRGLKRNVVLTGLMIAAIGVGIGASMTTLSMFRAMSADPLPRKSSQLFAVQIDNWGPDKFVVFPGRSDTLQDLISYTDAIGFMRAHAAFRQTPMYATALALTPSNPQLQPFHVDVRAAYSDFFPMFSVPFQYGAPWSATDDQSGTPVVVITRALNDKVFGGGNSVGKTLNLDNQQYRIVGVLNRWAPIPKFYDLSSGNFDPPEDIYLPFTRAIDQRMDLRGNNNCNKADISSGWDGHLHSECVWLQYWAELPSAADAARYRSFLANYAAEQRRSGRFQWRAQTQIRDIPDWLSYEHVVSDEARILVLVSFSFLFVCLLNAMGLMLAKTMGRVGDIGVRRALGASRHAVFSQCLMEAGVVGVMGGMLGVLLTALGLLGMRVLFSEDTRALTYLEWSDVGLAVGLAIAATVIAGLYPTWRATQVQPAWQLKAQ